MLAGRERDDMHKLGGRAGSYGLSTKDGLHVHGTWNAKPRPNGPTNNGRFASTSGVRKVGDLTRLGDRARPSEFTERSELSGPSEPSGPNGPIDSDRHGDFGDSMELVRRAGSIDSGELVFTRRPAAFRALPDRPVSHDPLAGVVEVDDDDAVACVVGQRF